MEIDSIPFLVILKLRESHPRFPLCPAVPSVVRFFALPMYSMFLLSQLTSGR
jgi:hypothetical protein